MCALGAGVSDARRLPRSLLVLAVSGQVGPASGWTSTLGFLVWPFGPLAVTEVLCSGHLPPTVKSPHVGEFCFLIQASEGALAGMLVDPSLGELPQPDHPAVQEFPLHLPRLYLGSCPSPSVKAPGAPGQLLQDPALPLLLLPSPSLVSPTFRGMTSPVS